MSANNSFTIIGNLTKTPEIRKTSSGKDFAFVTVAVNGAKDKPDFVSVLTWNKLSQTIVKYCKKGDCVAFTGYISTSVKDGNSSIILNADDAKFIYKAKKNEEPAPEKKEDPKFEPENDTFTTPDIFAPM